MSGSDWFWWCGVFSASLIGSMHCVGMCGPLAVLAADPMRTRRGWDAIAVYHGARIAVYGLLGAVVGLLGASLQWSGQWFGLQRLGAQLAGATMLLIGLASLARLAGGQSHQVLLPSFLQSWLAKAHAATKALPRKRRAAAVGALTGLLPCGWLYAFLLAAASTSSAWQGAWVMMLFGLGAVPALSATVLGAQWITGRWRRAIPWVSALLVTFIGLDTLGRRAIADLGSLHSTNAVAAPLEGRELIRAIEKIDSENLPCCQPDGAANQVDR
ncbi:MAG: sulfite exporter TauE/SafE family protein [Pirellulaceae bacterium]|jgi:sulfite exporter TauE/SafE